MTGLKLKGHVVGTRLHDPECDVGDVCDQIFLTDRKFLSSGPDKGPLRGGDEWLRGSYWIGERHYCVVMRGISRRCYALMERNDGLTFLIGLGGENGNPRLVTFHSDADSYKHF